MTLLCSMGHICPLLCAFFTNRLDPIFLLELYHGNKREMVSTSMVLREATPRVVAERCQS